MDVQNTRITEKNWKQEEKERLRATQEEGRRMNTQTKLGVIYVIFVIIITLIVILARGGG